MSRKRRQRQMGSEDAVAEEATGAMVDTDMMLMGAMVDMGLMMPMVTAQGMTTVDMVATEVMVDTAWEVDMVDANRRDLRHINSMAPLTPFPPHNSGRGSCHYYATGAKMAATNATGHITNISTRVHNSTTRTGSYNLM